MRLLGSKLQLHGIHGRLYGRSFRFGLPFRGLTPTWVSVRGVPARKGLAHSRSSTQIPTPLKPLQVCLRSTCTSVVRFSSAAGALGARCAPPHASAELTDLTFYFCPTRSTAPSSILILPVRRGYDFACVAPRELPVPSAVSKRQNVPVRHFRPRSLAFFVQGRPVCRPPSPEEAK